MTAPTRAEVCAVAVADAFRGDGEILASCFGSVPTLGARLARLTFAPDLMLTDGIASLIADTPPLSGPAAADGDGTRVVEGWLPFRSVFDLLWHGRRHVVMVASQIDRFGNQNFACIGPHAKPRAQLLGMRGAPGNTISHTTSYWIPNHSPQVFVEKVDVVSGVGYDRAARLPERTRRFHEIRRVVSNLGVFDFASSEGGVPCMRLRSVHPGVTVDDVVAATGFALAVPDEVPESRLPDAQELRLLREVLDPQGVAAKEVPAS